MNCKVEKFVNTSEEYQSPDGKTCLQAVLAGKIGKSRDDSNDYENYISIGEVSVSKFLLPFHGKKVWCIWAINEIFLTPQEILMNQINKIIGNPNVNRGAVYSEPTGYLWTDDEGIIGGHDLVHIMGMNKNKYGFICVREHPINLNKVIFV